MGYTVKSIAYQFKGSNAEENGTKPSILSRVINKANNAESEQTKSTSYESYSKDIMEDKNNISITKPINQAENITNNTNNVNNTVTNEIKEQNKVSGARKAFNVGKEFMNFGMYMAERTKFQK